MLCDEILIKVLLFAVTTRDFIVNSFVKSQKGLKQHLKSF